MVGNLVGELLQHERIQGTKPDRLPADPKVAIEGPVHVLVAVSRLIDDRVDVGREVVYETALSGAPNCPAVDRVRPESAGLIVSSTNRKGFIGLTGV